MAWPTPPMWRLWMSLLAWLVLLALLPWWLGLSLLLALTMALLLSQHRRVSAHASSMRSALRWGLPGVLWSLQRGLGGDAFAWGAALLGALVGYTLLAGLEAWLDRQQRHAPLSDEQGQWPEIAMASIGPPGEIIELQPPLWLPGKDSESAACVAGVVCHKDEYRVDNICIKDAGSHFCIDPQGRWFALRMNNHRGVVLFDRPRGPLHRMRGWQLAGWHDGQPWLMRQEGDMPVILSTLLRGDDR